MGGLQQAKHGERARYQHVFFGSQYNQKIGSWTLYNDFIADGGGLDTNAFFSGPNPRPLGYYLYGCGYAASPAGYCNADGTAVDTNNLPNFTINGATYSPNGPNGQHADRYTLPINATYAGSGATVPLSQDVIQQGWWFIQKFIQLRR